MNDKIKTTINTYDKYAAEYSANVENIILGKQMNAFLSYLPKNSKILDLGCGSGRDALIFNKKGFNVTGIDLSKDLIRIARQKVSGVKFKVMDIRKLEFENEDFNGIWASASILHIPKNEISLVLTKLWQILKHEGVLYLSLKKGVGENFESDLRYGEDAYKFWSYFTKSEIQNLLFDAGFKDIYFEDFESETGYATNAWIEVFCKKLRD